MHYRPLLRYLNDCHNSRKGSVSDGAGAGFSFLSLLRLVFIHQSRPRKVVICEKPPTGIGSPGRHPRIYACHHRCTHLFRLLYSRAGSRRSQSSAGSSLARGSQRGPAGSDLL